tara:strand:+ start:1329 stop:1589 length:261 start_codon:yes stop_codon:yes gene_type:complete
MDLNPTITKNTCSWKYKSAGVNPTPRNDKPDSIAMYDPIVAQTYEILLSLKSLGTKINDRHAKPIITKVELNKKHERKFCSPLTVS